MDKIVIKGARENNLKNIDLELPKNKMIVMTGLSGSGKSSLAFDTIYAEGERRYVESLSSYARQFLGGSNKPDVDSIEGLSPSISIDQKSTNNNPRSTVGTVTEIYDYLRLLFARIGVPYCPEHHKPIKSQTVEEIVNKILEFEEGTKLIIYSPVIHGEKGTHKDLLDDLKKSGFSRVRVNGENRDLSEDIILDKNVKSDIDIVIDRIVIKEGIRSRLFEAVELSADKASGKVVVDIIGEGELVFSTKYACPLCNYSLPELEPRLFSFNSPYGACPECNGLGTKLKIDKDLVIPDKTKSLSDNCIVTMSEDIESIDYKKLEVVCKYYKIDMNKPFNKISEEKQNIILYGSPDLIEFKITTKSGNVNKSVSFYEGVINNLERRYLETSSDWVREWLQKFMIELECPVCNGARLNNSVLNILINKKNIFDITNMSIVELIEWFNNLKLNEYELSICELAINEIKNRLNFLNNVGLNYLTLSRSSGTLSGGESQRIRLATQIGSRLTGVLYVLDEPSIGLHQKDNEKLIKSLLAMRDLGNTLIVVEHDTDTMLASDYIVDIGPCAGEKGGYVVAAGTPKEVMDNPNSLTGKYLKGELKIEVPEKRRKGNKKYLEIIGAKANNLKNVNVKIPLGVFNCVTGVSGSGKSSLINEILMKKVSNVLYKSKEKPLLHDDIKGIDNIDKLVFISQNPIGRTPRSNPATYTGVFDDIRELFTNTKEAKMLGYGKNRFSFNVKGGRCEACWGDGVKKIEMHFLPDVYVPCEVCHGSRYNSETLNIKYKDKSISDVLDMRISDALEFFDNIPKIKNKLQVLNDVGLGYIKLGQSATTLSGGEAGRVKLAKELQKRATGKSLFILDEPTTGLHTDDIKRLLVILNRIVDNGDTVIVIEHNLDVIKVADHIIDLGPDGGSGGGMIIGEGTPEEISKIENSYTGEFLRKVL